jgi:hypothetical protein
MESVGVTLVQIGLVALLAFVVEVLVEHLVGKPLETAAPYFPRWWLIYVSLVGGVAAGWFSTLNVFAETPMPMLEGRILTALLIGGGSQVIHKVVDKARDPYGDLGSPTFIRR